jgi:hypothetical protein
MPIFKEEVNANNVRKNRLKILSERGVIPKTEKGKLLSRIRTVRWPLGSKKYFGFSHLNMLFSGRLKKEVDSFFSKNNNRKMFVLDWGCYSGKDIIDLSMDDRLEAFGFTRDAHPNMLSPKRAKIINTEKKQFLRFLEKKGISFDLVYSRMGLTYLSAEELVSHLSQLKKHISLGGKVFTGVSWLKKYPEALDALKKEGFKIDFDHKGFCYLTRIK